MNKKNKWGFDLHVCVICGDSFRGLGANPYPIKDKGRCCSECDKKVIMVRILKMKEQQK
jgi:hypothetical protein